MTTVTFDLDGVLIRNPFRDGIFPRVCAALAPGFAGSEERAMEAIRLEHRERLFRSLEGAEPSVSAYDWDAIFAAVARSCGLEGIPDRPVAEWVRHYAAAGPYIGLVHPSVPPALEALRAAGLRLAVVTNGLWRYQEPVLEALGILGSFDLVAAPDLCGAAKPDPAAFRCVLGEQAEGDIHVGDDLFFDVAGARLAGMRTVWVIPPRLGRDRALASLAPWERPAALERSPAWEAEIQLTLRHYRADDALQKAALPDAAVLHVGEIPALLERWAGARDRRRWTPVALPLRRPGDAIVAWFTKQHRDLPWRRDRDPYRVMVSEFMLQQTQVVTAIPYFERFMARFPTVHALAEARLEDALEVWQGLGYYRRARYLHEAARIIVREHGGTIPDEPQALRRLPGVGPYMAGAIASIAFGRSEPAIDTNATRVLSRLVLAWDPPGPRLARHLANWARGMMPPGQAAELTQGLMELGARVCRPEPLCTQCPIQRDCAAWAFRLHGEIPAQVARKARAPRVRVAVAVVRDPHGHILLVRRPLQGLLGGLWALPSTAVQDGESWEAAAERALREQSGLRGVAGPCVATADHAFSHQVWEMRAFVVTPLPVWGKQPGREAGDGTASAAEGQGPAGSLPGVWAEAHEVARWPMGRAFRKLTELLAPAEAPEKPAT